MPLKSFDDTAKEILETSIDSALSFHLDAMAVAEGVRLTLIEGGVVSMRRLAHLEDDKARVRAVLKTDFGLDPAEDTTMRAHASDTQPWFKLVLLLQ